MVIRMLAKLESGTEELRENFNKKLETIIKSQEDLKKKITELKNILERLNSRLVNSKE